MSAADNLWILFAAQALVGFCGASGAVARAYIAEMVSPDNRSRAYGYIGGVAALGFILGPVIGGYLGITDLHLPFYAAAGMAALALVFAFFALKESLDPEDRRPFSWSAVMPFASIPVLLKSTPLARGVAIASLIEAFAVALPSGVFILFMQKSLHWSVAQAGLWLTLLSAGSALGAIVMTPIVIRLFGDKRAWLIGMAGTSLIFAMAGFIQTAWQMYLLILGSSLMAFVGPVALSLVSRSVAGNQLGEIHGSFLSLSGLIKAVSVPLGTWVYGYFSTPLAPIQFSGAVFFLSAAMQVPAVLYAFIILRKIGKESADDRTAVPSQIAVG